MCARYTVPRVPRTTVPGRFTFHMDVGNESLDIVHIHILNMYVCMYEWWMHTCLFQCPFLSWARGSYVRYFSVHSFAQPWNFSVLESMSRHSKQFRCGQVLFALCFPQACISLHRRHGLRLDTGNHSLVAGGLDMNEGGGNMQETGSVFKGHRRRNLLDLGSWSIFSLLEWFCERPRVQ